jgi:hypothetical protein
MIIQQKSGMGILNEKKKLINKYDKAYLRIYKENGVASYCKQTVGR